MKNKISIPQPRAVPGESVSAFNRRRRKKGEYEGGEWELGKVSNARYGIWNTYGSRKIDGRWIYDVVLERRSKSRIKYGRERGNNPIRIVVHDESITSIDV